MSHPFGDHAFVFLGDLMALRGGQIEPRIGRYIFLL